MNAQTKIEAAPAGLELLRRPFAENHISKLPKPTKKQTDEVKADFKKGVRCKECGSWHHPDVVHLDYVGHAALTDRLLDADMNWTWEPVAWDAEGLPAFDRTGGLWIKLTVLGVTRLGYGHAAPKPNADPGAREKEVIGDALRNAAMRFGAALDLWHKGDLHADEASEGHSQNGAVSPQEPSDLRDQLEQSVEQEKAKPVKLAGPITSKTALQTAVKGFIHQMNGCGDWDEWLAYRETKEAKDLLEQVRRDLPQWWDGGPDMAPEFIPLHRQIELFEASMALQIADIARA